MTGPEHYQQAEKCLSWAQAETDRDKRTSLQLRALVHMVGALVPAHVAEEAAS